MKRYNKKEDVKIGDRVLIDNIAGIFKDLVRVKIIGEVIDTELEGNLIQVALMINGIDDYVIKSVPYFLCQ